MYQLVFKGECTPGTSLDEARQQARALFKASLEQVDRMFSGQPVVIRNKLEQAQAEKYREVLHKHGMVAYVRPMPGTTAADIPKPSPERTSSSAPAASPAPAARPVGSEPARAAAAEAPAQAAAPSSIEVEPGDRLSVAGDKVDSILAGSGLSLDPVGVTLATHQEVEPPMFQHLDDWTLAPPGSDLGEERQQPPSMVPDVSHLSLVDDQETDR